MQELMLWKFLLERLNKAQPVVLLCVLESKGSSPGRQGFKMAVASDNMIGSIGGGMMEHKFVELAKEKLKLNEGEVIVQKQFHNKTAQRNQSGMICSGEQTIYLHQLKPAEKKTVEELIASLEQNKGGELQISADTISFETNAPSGKNFHFLLKSESEFEFREKIGFKNHLYVIGGGHCALAFSKLMSAMDFYIQLFEERKNLNTFLKNDFVNKKEIVESYSELKTIIEPGDNKYVVIMTFGYRTDADVIKALNEKQFKYIGVLGSKSKIEKLFKDLSSEGISKEQLQVIHAPIGLDIKSQTPEEIAVSIAAQIIQVKNKNP